MFDHLREVQRLVTSGPILDWTERTLDRCDRQLPYSQSSMPNDAKQTTGGLQTEKQLRGQVPVVGGRWVNVTRHSALSAGRGDTVEKT